MRSMKVFLYLLGLPILITACNSVSEPGSSTNSPVEVVEKEEKILIKDLTGKEWDITHAVKEYGFVANQFQYGLGPFAIQPIMDPVFAQSGENGFPSSQSSALIMGTTIVGDTRAYSIGVMSRFEVANDKFGTNYVAVAY